MLEPSWPHRVLGNVHLESDVRKGTVQKCCGNENMHHMGMQEWNQNPWEWMGIEQRE